MIEFFRHMYCADVSVYSTALARPALAQLLHWCASCAPDATSVPPALGVLGGAAGTAAAVAGYSHMNEPTPDRPIEHDDDGNSLAAAVLTLPLAAVSEAATGTEAVAKAISQIGEDAIDQAKGHLEDGVLNLGNDPAKAPYENPGDFRMGKSMRNMDGTVTMQSGDVLNPDQSITGPDGVTTTPYGYTKNPDGTVSPPSNQSPAFNPDGTPVHTTDPGDLPPVPAPVVPYQNIGDNDWIGGAI